MLSWKDFKKVCYIHACVVVQHYLVAMNNDKEIPMLNIEEYMKKCMTGDRLFQHIWNSKGSDSLDFLKNVLNTRPDPEDIFHCSNRNDFDSMDVLLKTYGPGLASGFFVSMTFIGADWQHLGKSTVEKLEGRHDVVLVNYRIVDGDISC